MRRREDRLLVCFALVHGALLFVLPTPAVLAIGIWWNSNTIAHNFVHRPFFRSRRANDAFALYQTMLLGIPQTLWRERHLAHHGDVSWRFQWSGRLGLELGLVLGLWTMVIARDPLFFAATYAPGYVVGLGLCAMQGYYEHVGATTTSHYGRLYNLLCFNDGYHREHHACPGVHWSELADRHALPGRVSRWPPLLRWLDAISLEGLERCVLRSPRLQRVVVAWHARAMARVLPRDAQVARVGIVGGGLFPRTVLVIQQLLPDARVVVIDRRPEHLATARRHLVHADPVAHGAVEFRCETFGPAVPLHDVDLLVIPLDFDGSREAVYERPPAPLVLVHDWLWRRRGVASAVVSPLLCKRINLVRA